MIACAFYGSQYHPVAWSALLILTLLSNAGKPEWVEIASERCLEIGLLAYAVRMHQCHS